MVCDLDFTFSVDVHKLTVTEVNRNNVKLLIVDSISILVGQRYSFI